MRQLEGKGEEGGVQTKGLPTPAKYNAGGDGAIATTPKEYNTDADTVGKKEKKEKKRKADDTPGESAKKKKSKKEKKEKKSKD